MQPSQKPSLRVIRAAIATSLRDGDPSLQHTACQLGVSVRSMQRRLSDMGTSYRELVDAVRIKTACHLLAESDERICDIAARLGFADASSFSRTFMRLMKIQPRLYRRQQKIGTLHQSLRGRPAGKRFSLSRPE